MKKKVEENYDEILDSKEPSKSKVIIFVVIILITAMVATTIFAIAKFNSEEEPSETSKKDRSNGENVQNVEKESNEENKTDEKTSIDNNDTNQINDNQQKSSISNENEKKSSNDDSNRSFYNNTTVSSSSAESKKYKCDSGWILDGSSCYKTYTATVEYKCSQGKLAGSSCIINTSVSANATYTCPSGYEQSGSTCYKWSVVATYKPSTSTTSESLNATLWSSFQNACATGGAIKTENNKCYNKVYTNPNVTYDCNGKNGELAGNMCISAKVEDAYAFYSCPDGGYFIDNGIRCKITEKATER